MKDVKRRYSALSKQKSTHRGNIGPLGQHSGFDDATEGCGSSDAIPEFGGAAGRSEADRRAVPDPLVLSLAGVPIRGLPYRADQLRRRPDADGNTPFPRVPGEEAGLLSVRVQEREVRAGFDDRVIALARGVRPGSPPARKTNASTPVSRARSAAIRSKPGASPSSRQGNETAMRSPSSRVNTASRSASGTSPLTATREPRRRGRGSGSRARARRVLKRSPGRVVGIEVTASATARPEDFRGLKRLKEAAGDSFARGVLLHDGARVRTRHPDCSRCPSRCCGRLEGIEPHPPVICGATKRFAPTRSAEIGL